MLAFSTGEVIALGDVKDQMFSAGLMGPGIAIESGDGKICSPVDGTVTMLFPTKHALGLKSEDGQELLLHIGIDTVGLKGEGFTAFVQDGQMLLDAVQTRMDKQGKNVYGSSVVPLPSIVVPSPCVK